MSYEKCHRHWFYFIGKNYGAVWTLAAVEVGLVIRIHRMHTFQLASNNATLRHILEKDLGKTRAIY